MSSCTAKTSFASAFLAVRLKDEAEDYYPLKDAEAEFFWKRALHLNVSDPRVWLLRAQFLQSAQQEEAALLAYSNAMQFASSDLHSDTNLLRVVLLGRARLIQRCGLENELATGNLLVRGIPLREPGT
jgi:hypothetical protein